MVFDRNSGIITLIKFFEIQRNDWTVRTSGNGVALLTERTTDSFKTIEGEIQVNVLINKY